MNVWPMIVRFFDAGQRAQKAILGTHGDEIDPEVRAERALHLIALVHPEQAGIDEDACKLITDRSMHERRGNRGIDASR